MSRSRPRIAVVGAGISGLAAAWELLKADCAVALYDRRQIGGLAGGFRCPDVDGVFIDKFYHHLFRTDVDMIALIEEVGLGSDLGWHPTRTGIWSEGRVWPLESPLDFLRCRPIGSLLQRVRMAMALRTFQTDDAWQPYDTVSCRDYFAARGALEAYERFWAPLLRAKFGKASDRIAASFIWGRIHPRAQSRVGGRETLGYLKGGFQRAFVTFAERIEQRGGTVRLSDPVVAITSDSDGATVTAASGTERFDAVLWTAAPNLLAEVVTNLTADAERRLTAVPYMAVTCLVLVMTRRQGDFYWINALDADISFGGLIEHTNFIPAEQYGGQHILYVVNYVDQDDPLLALNHKQLLERHLPSLRRVLPGFRPEDIRHAYDFKDRYSTPIYAMGHRARMPPAGGLIDRVWIAGMTQVYPEDRNQSHCIRAVKGVLPSLLASVRRRSAELQGSAR